MNNHKFFYRAALVFGLAASGATYAQQTPPMTAQERDAYRTQRQTEMRDLTPEQRSEMQASRNQNSGAQGMGQGTMARDGSGAGGRYGSGGGQGGGRGRGR